MDNKIKNMNTPPTSLLDYVNTQYKVGIPPETIKTELRAYKWKSEDIDNALNMVQAGLWHGSANAPKSQTSHESQLIRVFRLGFASIFLANGLTAWLRPEDFEGLLLSFPLAEALGHTDLMIMFAGLNDLVLCGLILSGKAKKFVWAWAGSWLAMVSLIKLTTLL